ncbi:MAG: hypothetical protein HRU08_07190 [Oleispira sp.]|nr:hypothetical protein [Oleispira sp.]
MKKNRLNTLLTSTIITTSVLISAPSFAVGTDAGTAISNTATVNFTRGGSPDSEQASASFNVDEVINVNVTALTPSNNVTNGDQGVALTYTVTNIGNGPEAFKLFDAIGATNDLPLSAGDLTVYYVPTATSDGSFNPNDINETLYTDTDITINNDESITVYIVADVPNGSILNSLTDLELTAVSQTEAGGIKAGESIFGTVIPNAGENSTNAIIAAEQGRDSTSSPLKVTTYDPTKSLDVTITKTVLGSNALVNNTATTTDQKIPGAQVTYFVKVTVKNDTATALNISDIIPVNMTYVAASLRKQLAAGSVINTPTYIAPALPAGTPSTYSNFNSLTDTNSDSDGGETIPNTGTVTSIKVDFGDLAPGEYAILLDATINN